MPSTNFQADLKGKTIETLAQIIFEYVGYKVVQLGIEKIIPDTTTFSSRRYNLIDPTLKSMPDFFIYHPEYPKLTFQVEVKFRKNFNFTVRQNIMNLIESQIQFWPNVYYLIFTSNPPLTNANYFQDYIRVVPPSFSLNSLISGTNSSVWQNLPEIHQEFFPNRQLRMDNFSFDSLIPLICELGA